MPPSTVRLLLVILVLATSCAGALPAAQPSHMQVLVIGDSLTMGLYASSEATTYRNQLHQMLASTYPAQEWTVTGQVVCTLVGLEQYWPTRSVTPDLVFIEIGINDASGWPKCPQIPEHEWQQRYGAMLKRIRTDAPDAVLIVGNIPWSGYDSGSRQKPLRYNGWIMGEANRLHIPVADLWQWTVDRSDSLSTPNRQSPFEPGYKGDNFHPNDLGHNLIARSFFNAYVRQRR